MKEENKIKKKKAEISELNLLGMDRGFQIEVFNEALRQSVLDLWAVNNCLQNNKRKINYI